MNPPELREDLKQELFIVLCEMNSEKLFELDNRNELRFYSVRIMLNLIQSKTSPFYYQFRKHLEITCEITADTPEKEVEKVCEETFIKMFDQISNRMQGLTWYEQNLFNLYIEKNKNASAMSRETR
ncbi:MAG TPA: hypothetical protein VMY77_14560, partial [Chitinophagaceae bacterium]|nr:hypothetical protein [Chitinophagaceae bacterium]